MLSPFFCGLSRPSQTQTVCSLLMSSLPTLLSRPSTHPLLSESAFFGPGYVSVMDGSNVCLAHGMGGITPNDGGSATTMAARYNTIRCATTMLGNPPLPFHATISHIRQMISPFHDGHLSGQIDS